MAGAAAACARGVTVLARMLAARIAATGPVSLAEYMAECLMHPKYGYYTTRDPLGAGGDFTTAPEISQMFGELIGLCLVQAWQDQGAPSPFVLAELGPGRGTLMADALRAARLVPDFVAAARLHLVEASPALREAQSQRLAAHVPVWHSSVRTLPEGALFVIANEFFDALPIRQFVRRGRGWAERMVGLDGDRLAFGLSPPLPVADLEGRLADCIEGDVVETCPAAGPVISALAGRIAASGGVALVFDYGAGPSLGDTFQALRGHRSEHPLANPGAADLTAHVDFAALAAAANSVPGVRIGGPLPQGLLLERLGIDARARMLARGLQGAALELHLAAHRRLTDPAEMGRLFKALALAPAGAPLPPGFEP